MQFVQDKESELSTLRAELEVADLMLQQAQGRAQQVWAFWEGAAVLGTPSLFEVWALK